VYVDRRGVKIKGGARWSQTARVLTESMGLKTLNWAPLQSVGGGLPQPVKRGVDVRGSQAKRENRARGRRVRHGAQRYTLYVPLTSHLLVSKARVATTACHQMRVLKHLSWPIPS
jgi:hypothetical protein